jgi:deoxyribodipyrimidine photo-lyase
MKRAIWWVRRDLRLRANAALVRCAAEGGAVIPVFILDPAILERGRNGAAERRTGFLFGGLRALDASLTDRRGRLIVRRGRPAAVLRELLEESGADMVCAEEDFSPYARTRDEAVAREVPLRLTPGVSIHHPREVVKRDGSPYTVFTPFSRAWQALPFPYPDEAQIPENLDTPADLKSLPLPEVDAPLDFTPGEQEARRRLTRFLEERISPYRDGRNRLDLDGTSALSAYFRFGMISVREAAGAARTIDRAQGGSEGAAAWLNELAWRDFYLSVLFHFPRVLREEFNPAFRSMRWRRDDPALHAWQHGQTGFPVVDAGMRQLLATGWMHNRARMITASFLVKDLLIDWREGERWFSRHLVDGDPAANNGGWQWAAGVGTDAAPYFRVFNPVIQGERFDPLGEYVRRWVPELSGLPARWIHRPWEAPPTELAAAGIALGRTYPPPIVDHARARLRALAVFGEGKRR